MAVVGVVSVTLALLAGGAQPAQAYLSPRCGNPQFVAYGVTLMTCVSADLNNVYGDGRLYLNQAGVDDHHGEIITVITDVAYKHRDGSNFGTTGALNCHITVPNSVPHGGYISCSGQPAVVANASGWIYQSEAAISLYGNYVTSPWVDP
ncbi:MAG TPA: hypothetical protein VF486_08300 [Actinomycetes bacterium]